MPGLKVKVSRLLFIFLFVCGAAGTRHAHAQAVPDTSLNNIIRDDSVRKQQDTTFRSTSTESDSSIPVTPLKKGPFQPNPKKAGLYSSILPGSGQLYNRQYWKVPLIYVAIGVTGYVFINNYDNYQSYRKAYIGRINNPYPTDQYVNVYTTDQLNQLQNDYSRYVDLTILVGVLEYTVQVVDAITSAHLKNFDISRDISMHLRPMPFVAPTGMGIGLNLVVNLKSHTNQIPFDN
jgi:hypothetical protein